MSIATEITRLQNAKSALATSIGNKGVTVPAATKLDGYAALVDSIQTGGGGGMDDIIAEFKALTIPADEHIVYLCLDCYDTITTGLDCLVNFQTRGGGQFYIQRGKVTNGAFVEDGSSPVLMNSGIFWNKELSLPRDCGRFVTYKIYSSTNNLWYGYVNGNSFNINRTYLPLVAVKENCTNDTYSSASRSLLYIKRRLNKGNYLDCSSLKYVDLSSIDWSGVTSLQNLFNGCTLLPHVDMTPLSTSSGITNMGSAFRNCFSLMELDLSMLNFNLSNCNNTFQECQNLQKIKLPASFSLIGTQAFSNCLVCLTYIFEATTPPTITNTNAFYNLNANAKIYVPDASVEAYKTATNWSTYASKIYPMSDLTE